VFVGGTRGYTVKKESGPLDIGPNWEFGGVRVCEVKGFLREEGDVCEGGV
jgi:hypothetical protein